MAQQLRIGLRGLRRLDAGPVVVDGRDAWRQTFEAGAPPASARVTTVTLVAGRCSFDWILVAPGPSPAGEATLASWCASFRLDPARFPEAAR
jgi:hypothetical protein